MMCSPRNALGIMLVLVATVAFTHAQDSGAQAPKIVPPVAPPQPAVPEPIQPALTLPPEPATGKWQLDFYPGELRLYIDPQTGKGFWYFTYKVVNRTGLDRWWGPRFEMMDDQGRLRRSGKDISMVTLNRIEALIGNKLVEDQYEVQGEIHQGEEHAKESFVVWNAEPLDATQLHLFVRGMSSELKRVPNPSGGGEPILMYKSMKLDFRVVGDPVAFGSKPVPCEQTQWVLR
ncbi:MAG: hypothetical protein EXS15_01940 [Phycisphaerales bacterium]|nr:hypothetical protein [Phycisphaerales bacterium]